MSGSISAVLRFNHNSDVIVIQGMGTMGITLSLNLSSTISTLTGSTFGGALQSPLPAPPDTPKDEDLSDNDEPLLSGSGNSEEKYRKLIKDSLQIMMDIQWIY